VLGLRGKESMKKYLAIFVVLAFLVPNVSFSAFAWTVDSGGTLSNNLISYWAQEDLTDSFGTNDQTGINSPTFTEGKNGNALTLNGTNQYTTVASGTIPLTNNFSFSLWTRASSTAHYFGGDSVGGKQTYFDYNNNVGGEVKWNKATVGGQVGIQFATSSDIGIYRHFIITQSPTAGMKVFLNGVDLASSADTSAHFNTGAVWEWGSFQGLNSPFKGQMDEIAVWNRALTSQEISDLYNSGTGSFYVGSADVATAPTMQVIWFD